MDDGLPRQCGHPTITRHAKPRGLGRRRSHSRAAKHPVHCAPWREHRARYGVSHRLAHPSRRTGQRRRPQSRVGRRLCPVRAGSNIRPEGGHTRQRQPLPPAPPTKRPTGSAGAVARASSRWRGGVGPQGDIARPAHPAILRRSRSRSVFLAFPRRSAGPAAAVARRCRLPRGRRSARLGLDARRAWSLAFGMIEDLAGRLHFFDEAPGVAGGAHTVLVQ